MRRLWAIVFGKREKQHWHVTPNGQTVVDARELLADPKVKQFMAEFSPLVQKYIAAAKK